MKEHFLRWR